MFSAGLSVAGENGPKPLPNALAALPKTSIMALLVVAPDLLE